MCREYACSSYPFPLPSRFLVPLIPYAFEFALSFLIVGDSDVEVTIIGNRELEPGEFVRTPVLVPVSPKFVQFDFPFCCRTACVLAIFLLADAKG